MMNEILVVLSILVLCCYAASLEPQREKNESRDKLRIKRGIKDLTNCDHCGLSFEDAAQLPILINGTNKASVAKYPWMVSLVDDDCDEAFCGGALLSKNYVLTAAHCVFAYVNGSCYPSNNSCRPSPNFFVMFYTPEWYNGVKPRVQADRVMIHHDFFHDSGKPHDIALIKLVRRIKCNTLANPICLPPSSVVLQMGQHVRFSGYGKLKPLDPQASSLLHEGVIKVIKKERCKAMGFLQEDMGELYCLEGYKGHTTCYGDSGGSMFGRLYKKGGFVTLGVASLQSSPMCFKRAKVVYTSVAHNLEWIQKKMADDQKNDEMQKKK